MFFWANGPAIDEDGGLLLLPTNDNVSPPLSVLEMLSLPEENIDWRAIVSRACEAPGDLTKRDATREDTPLVRALQRDCPYFVVETFLRIHPRMASQVQRIGITPLHVCVARGHPKEVIQLVLEAWPVAASKRMTDGCVPLHFVQDVETARLLIDAFPRALHMKNNASYLPIHRVAYASYAPAELVQFLIDAEQEAIATGTVQSTAREGPCMHQLATKTFHGIAPLDAACEMVERDLRQRKPVATLRRRKLEILALATYHNQQPELAHAEEGKLLLHALLQVSSSPSISIIKYTLERYPEQRVLLDHHGRSALSVAAGRRRIPAAVMDVLLQDPVLRGLANTPDNNGRWPLHHAAVSGRHFDDGVRAIWKAAPTALTVPDRQAGLYPSLLAALAAENDNDEDVVATLNTVFCLLRETPWLIPRTTTATITFASNSSPLWSSDKRKVQSTLCYIILPVLVAVLIHFAFGGQLASHLKS